MVSAGVRVPGMKRARMSTTAPRSSIAYFASSRRRGCIMRLKRLLCMSLVPKLRQTQIQQVSPMTSPKYAAASVSVQCMFP